VKYKQEGWLGSFVSARTRTCLTLHALELTEKGLMVCGCSRRTCRVLRVGDWESGHDAYALAPGES
jgi:hypothetical protein